METIELRKCVARVAELRRRIREADETVSDWDLRDWWDEARFELGKVRLFGDLVIAAFFEGTKPKERKAKRDEYAGAVFTGEFGGYRKPIERRRQQDPPLAPFHWGIEFPEVFEPAPSATGEQVRVPFRLSRGFDAIVGNPPFAGKNSVAAGNVPQYTDWLKQVHAESHGNADLVAHFFRRALGLVRDMGVFGLVATNTIAQGDTRASGLRWICKNGGDIFSVRRRVKWPGLAAVVVSVIHAGKGLVADRKRIDDRDVDRITAFLFHRGGHDDPARLAENAAKSFQGSIVLGMGFTFDDTDTKGAASSLAEMRRLVAKDPRNQEVIFPYIGGQEVNTSPTHVYHRYVINFQDFPLCREAAEADQFITEEAGAAARGPAGLTPQTSSWINAPTERRVDWLRTGRVPLDYPDPVAEDWPDLRGIVEERVKPERMKVKRQVRRNRWWQFGDRQPALYKAIAGLERVIVISRLGQHVAFAFLPSRAVFADRLIVFPFDTYSSFCTLQSRIHELWARFFGSTMKDDLLYTPSDCFATFPFPDGWMNHPILEAAGCEYHKSRADYMHRNGEGLTKTYNRFHDPNESGTEIHRLRQLHSTMDAAVLSAYGWTDVPTACEFLLEHHTEEDERGNKKRPYRYRWPDDIRNEVLARLLELNGRRAVRQARGTAGNCASRRP